MSITAQIQNKDSSEFIYLYEELQKAELLSYEDLLEMPQYMLDIGNKSYWLKDSNIDNKYIQYVEAYGKINKNGFSPSQKLYIRPVIKFKSSYTGIPGQHFIFGNKVFTTINSLFGVCEDVLLSYNYDSTGITTYEQSEVKKYIDDWFGSIQPPTPTGEHTIVELNQMSGAEVMNLIGNFAKSLQSTYNILPSVVAAQTQAETGNGEWKFVRELAITVNNCLGMDTNLNNDTWKDWTVWDGKSASGRFRGYPSAEKCIQDYMAWQGKGGWTTKAAFNPVGEKDYVKEACKCAYHYTPACITISSGNLFEVLGEPLQPLNWRGVMSSPPENPEKLDFYMKPWGEGGFCYVYAMDTWNKLNSTYLGSICSLIDRYNLTQFDN